MDFDDMIGPDDPPKVAKLKATGRKASRERGRQIVVYLNDAHDEIAITIGDGNRSLGIRKALEAWQESEKKKNVSRDENFFTYTDQLAR